MKAEVSVVLPAYNAEKTIRRAVQSILSQTMANLECIVVDDGSTDNTGAELSRIHDERLKVIPIDHMGITGALNRGLREAQSQYIARMDADDVSYPKRLETQVAYLEEHSHVGVVSCLVDHLGNRENQKGYGLYVAWLNRQRSWPEIESALLIESPLAHPSVMYRKAVIEEIGGYRDGPFPEDYDLWLRLAALGVKMEKVPQTLLEWHDLPKRLSRTDSRYSAEAFFQIKIPYLLEVLKRKAPSFPRFTIWGAGKLARRKARILKEHGMEIVAYIDIDPKKVGTLIEGVSVIDPNRWNLNSGSGILSLVSGRGARERVKAYLVDQGAKKDRDFFLA
ncbi:MAG: glycosyl transferase family 2 [Acidobacteria bacterium]|nr:MAG: glycosyl transferase family 2 [Acidobacteriota bacterium]